MDAPEPTDVQFEILGPVAVVAGRARREIRPRRQSTLLAELVLHADRVVSTDVLVETLWDEPPPSTARRQVHTCVWAVRRVLEELDCKDVLVRGASGYRLRVAPDQVDVGRFRRWTAEAAQLADAGRTAEAIELESKAIALWQGPPLADVTHPALRAQADRLTEELLLALETRTDLELTLGQHYAVVGELTERVARHPLRSKSRWQLMLALHLSGRQADALDVYRTGRRLLVNELGLEPDRELRALESLILADDERPHPIQISGRDRWSAPDGADRSRRARRRGTRHLRGRAYGD